MKHDESKKKRIARYIRSDTTNECRIFNRYKQKIRNYFDSTLSSMDVKKKK